MKKIVRSKGRITIMWVVMTFLLGLIAYDAWACNDRKHHETISEMVTKASSRYLMIPLIFGILMGHFFWQSKDLP